MWPFTRWSKKTQFNDEKKEKFIEAISRMLQVQLIAAGDRSIEDGAGDVNPRALGYIYGFIDPMGRR
jgi:hypothetical protein